MNKRILLNTLVILFLSGCAATTVLSNKQIMQQFPTLSEANILLAQAKANNLAYYSPEQMKAAQRVFDDAMKQAKAGKASAKVTAQEAVDRLNAADNQAKKAKYVFDEVFNARQKALAVNADSLVAEKFESTEKQFKKMLAWLEIGEEERAKRDINQVKNQYLEIELAALKSNMLGIAEKTIATAKQENLDDIAPIILAQAQDEYQLALDTLEADRADTLKANVHSNKAIWLVKRAQSIADVNRYFVDADFTEEQKILWFQEQMSVALSPLMGELQFNQSNKELIAEIQATLAQEVEENQVLSMSVTSLNDKLAALQSQSKNRESQLSQEKEQAILAGQLELEKEQQAKREDDARFSGVQSLFSEDEANVYRQLDNVLIRAQGFSFKTGSSEIDSSNFALLNKIIDAVSRFPNANIVVSGHTDATGSAELNLQLSKDRAQTVASFMTQVGNIANTRIESRGYGKEKPVASNESVEGRAQNRRVEILIIN